jgi:hypothetical protein
MKTNPTEAATTKAPTHVAYQVKNREGKKAIWTRIGSAWAHSDGQGFNIQLDAIPIDGRVTLRIRAEKDE